MINTSFSSFAINLYCSGSPFLAPSIKSHYFLQSSSFFRLFSSVFVSDSLIRVYQSNFRELLSCAFSIQSLFINKQAYRTQFQFSYDQMSEFRGCLFENIISNTLQSCAISFKCASYSILIYGSAFHNLKYTGSGYHASGFYSEPADTIQVSYVCFDKCKSKHGASYGLLSNSYIIKKLEFNYTYETNLGYGGYSQPCPSFYGGRESVCFQYNNISESRCSALFITLSLTSKHNSVLRKFTQINDCESPNLLAKISLNDVHQYTYSNFINNTITGYAVYNHGGSSIPVVDNCIFFMGIPLMHNFQSAMTILDSSFSAIYSTSVFKSVLTNAQCSFGISYSSFHLVLSFEHKLCWEFNDMTYAQKQQKGYIINAITVLTIIYPF